MRRLLALVSFAGLLVATPSLAADRAVEVGDDYFLPGVVQVEKDDTVTWNWSGNEPHNVVNTPGKRQIERFRSGSPQTGGSFRHTFKNEGSFTYLCTEHSETMRGRVRVGTDDDVKPRIRRLKARVYKGDNVKVVFRLSERAVLAFKLRGPEDKTRTRVRSAGKRSLKFRNLADGEYKVSVIAKDGFGNKRKRSKRFEIG